MSDYEYLLDTRDGLLIAHSAYEEGRQEGRREVLADWNGITRQRVKSPYLQPLLKKNRADQMEGDDE